MYINSVRVTVDRCNRVCNKTELPLLLNHAEQVAKDLEQILIYPLGSQSSFFLKQIKWFSPCPSICVFFAFKKTFWLPEHLWSTPELKGVCKH